MHQRHLFYIHFSLKSGSNLVYPLARTSNVRKILGFSNRILIVDICKLEKNNHLILMFLVFWFKYK